MAKKQDLPKSDLKKIRVPGFRFSGVSSGIKGKGKLDLALMVGDQAAKAVAVFTKNRVQAAPVLQGKQVLRNGRLQALVINSGNANAVTGPQGIKNAFRMAEVAARSLEISPNDVLVSSTGKIGVPLDMSKITQGITRAKERLSHGGVAEAARAIMTTDQFPKVRQIKGSLGGKTFHLTGIAKGAGMIEPHMATMLAYLFTDLDLALPLMRRMFREAVQKSFNSITVDGDSSTNDTALFLANGLSGISLRSGRETGAKKVAGLLEELCQSLARMIVLDGEGATKAVEVVLRGAKNHAAARAMAYSIARSPLVKTSFFGEDPNWGRVLCALGYSGEDFDPSRVDIYYGPHVMVRRGRPAPGARATLAKKLMKNNTFTLRVELHQGPGQARVLTSDLTYDYVKINAEYSS